MTLEELLNILLERGWKPRNREKTLHIWCYDKCKWMDYQWVYLDGWFMNEDHKKFRELVSKESWLWQFVCENGMIIDNFETQDGDTDKWICYYNCDGYECDNYYELNRKNYKLWLIESALCDEDKLEEFLLDNIEIQWK